MKRLGFLLAALGACFGEGPTPTTPTGATIVMSVAKPVGDDECSGRYYLYIAGVALAGDAGYAMTLPYVPQWGDCDGSGGGNTPQIEVPVHSFAKNGGSTTMIGIAGRSNFGSQPRIAAATSAGWAYMEQTANMGTQVYVRGTTLQNTMIPMNMGFYSPVAMTADANAFYIAGLQSGGSNGRNNDVNDPSYPCCGPLSPPSDVDGRIFAVTQTGTMTTLPIQPKFNHQTLKNALVNNTTSLFYTEYEPPITSSSATLVRSVLKNGTSPLKVGTIPRASGVPVGLGASDAFVAWSSSIAYEFFPALPQCRIGGYDLVTSTEVQLFNTTQFSCMDAATDGTHVYFAIVDVEEDHSQNMRGLGLGRVSIATKTFESIRTGVTGRAAGARRVYLDGTDVYAVDPFVVAKIAKSAFDGMSDFEP